MSYRVFNMSRIKMYDKNIKGDEYTIEDLALSGN